MRIIGLTGGIASGKSTVSSMLAQLGAYIINVDEIARDIVMPRQPAWFAIVEHFGKGILLPDGMINRQMLGDKIFNDQAERQYLERVTHPYIEEQVRDSIAVAERCGEDIVVLDIPLLFEVGWQKMVNSIWVVYVEKEIQLSRLMARNQLTHRQAVDRIDAQMSLTDKVKQADIVIDNNLNLEDTRKQVHAAWKKV